MFGSMAGGDAGPDSDYDLMLIVPDDATADRQQTDLANKVLWGIATAADIIIWQRSRFERRSHVVCSLPATVLRDGKVLYAS